MEHVKFYRRIYAGTPEMLIFEDYGDLYESEKNKYTYVLCKDIREIKNNEDGSKTIYLSKSYYCAVDFESGLILYRHDKKANCKKFVEENCERLIISSKNFLKRYSQLNIYAKSSAKFEK